MRTRSWLLAVLLFAGAGVAGFFVARLLLAPATPEVSGEALPPLELKALDGGTLRLTDWPGKLVLINFWASWCAPCMNEIPHLVAAQKTWGARGLQVVGPALDEPDAVRPLVQRFGINYPVTADFAGGSAALQALGNAEGALPYSVLVSRDGRVLTTVLGALSAEELERLIGTFID